MTNLDTTALTGWAFPARDDRTLAVASPLDGHPIGDVPQCSPSDVAAAAAKARASRHVWLARSPHERAKVADRFRDLVLDNAEALLDLIHLENGKSRLHAFEEVLDAALCAGYYARTAAKHLATRTRGGAIPLLTRTVERRVPEGVVGIISPWNYPLTLVCSDAIPALLAGNAVIIKPDSATPVCALAV
jgi:succinate-semialdehyde dehydrogenase/glutarate-semialdehyde dehydrogenase